MNAETAETSGWTGRPRRALRNIADRAVAPYIDRLSREIGEASSAVDAPADPDDGSPASDVDPVDPRHDDGVPSDYFHMMLHELRTLELERSRGEHGRAVSVGASGRWYFDWFEGAVGAVQEHVGVEAFEPEPDDLPDYVTWIATTADRFEGVDDDSVGLVFAGQTTEHLWAEELADFLLQARRVLRHGGQLVLDSPNRLVTEHLYWSHGGHTVELAADEIAELVALAGFDIDRIVGLWKCRLGDDVLGLEERLEEGATVVRRIADGAAHPDDCFVWWLVAHPSDTAPDVDALHARAVEMYAEHWPTRVCRGMWPGPGAPGPVVEAGVTERVETLPFMLRAGRHRVGLRLADGAIGDVANARVTLSLPGDHVVHDLGLDAAQVDDDTVSWEFDQPDLMFALTLTLEVTAARRVQVEMPLVFERVG